MANKAISGGTVHDLPKDIRKAFASSAGVLVTWEDITPLARNEWICWATCVKRPETRRKHVERMVSELRSGKRRPCCWAGCPHRKKG